MQIGKLYQIKKYYWLVYPSKETAACAGALSSAADAAGFSITSAENLSDDLSESFNCNVTYISRNDIFCLLEKDRKYLKVLSTNGELGWMIHPESEAWT